MSRARLFFRLGRLYRIAFASRGSLPQSWNAVRKGVKVQEVGSCQDMALKRSDNKKLGYMDHNSRTPGGVLIALSIGTTKMSFLLESRQKGDEFVRLVELHKQFVP